MPDITPPKAPTKLFGIIGHPLGHTMSPALHNWGFKRMGVDGEYRAFPTPPEDLGAFMQRLRALPIMGLSVTIPHKLAVMEHLDGVSERVKAVGACNTLYWDGDRLLGENTDVTGFTAPLKALPVVPGSALVLGAGGAARAAVAGLMELGVDSVAVTARDEAKAEALAGDFGAAALPWGDRGFAEAELIVNATPLGMLGERREMSPLPETARLSPGQVAYDLVYNPVGHPFPAPGRGPRLPHHRRPEHVHPPGRRTIPALDGPKLRPRQGPHPGGQHPGQTVRLHSVIRPNPHHIPTAPLHGPQPSRSPTPRRRARVVR